MTGYVEFGNDEEQLEIVRVYRLDGFDAVFLEGKEVPTPQEPSMGIGLPKPKSGGRVQIIIPKEALEGICRHFIKK